MTHDEMIAILEAERDGKTVECRNRPSGTWIKKPHQGILPASYDYRIKPQPRRGEGWIDLSAVCQIIWPSKRGCCNTHIRWEQIMEDES